MGMFTFDEDDDILCRNETVLVFPKVPEFYLSMSNVTVTINVVILLVYFNWLWKQSATEHGKSFTPMTTIALLEITSNALRIMFGCTGAGVIYTENNIHFSLFGFTLAAALCYHSGLFWTNLVLSRLEECFFFAGNDSCILLCRKFNVLLPAYVAVISSNILAQYNPCAPFSTHLEPYALFMGLSSGFFLLSLFHFKRSAMRILQSRIAASGRSPVLGNLILAIKMYTSFLFFVHSSAALICVLVVFTSIVKNPIVFILLLRFNETLMNAFDAVLFFTSFYPNAWPKCSKERKIVAPESIMEAQTI